MIKKIQTPALSTRLTVLTMIVAPFKSTQSRTRRTSILARFRATLDDLYGDRLERVVLFGSRARGDARPNSDYDIAVFLRDMEDRWEELDRLAMVRLEFLEQTGVFFDAKPYISTAYRNATPLMGEIRREGLTL